MAVERTHHYHAESTVVFGHLRLPFTQVIERQAHAKVPGKGGYLSQHTDSFRVEGVVSYRSAHTQVSGHRESKPGRGWKTLATSVVEGLNILEVVTADRVVAQISTEHPLDGYVPEVTFLGTRFENLRIAGHPVKLDLDLNVLGDRSKNDTAYSVDSDLKKRIAKQKDLLRGLQDVPSDSSADYNQGPSIVDDGDSDTEDPTDIDPTRQESIECSLVNQAEGSYPGRSFGYVIDVPHFGKIYLATLRVEHSKFKKGTDIPTETVFHLSMIKVKMGCLADGEATVAGLTTNGHTKP